MDNHILKDYFKRTGYKGSLSPALKTLESLHTHHIQSIAFENLNALLGLPVKLDLDSLVEKLIYNGRGGYCFEQNLLHWEVLKTLGFKVKGLEARVLPKASEKKILPRTHMLLLVKTGRVSYITDVGFGGLNPAIPLVLEPKIIQKSTFEEYRLLKKDANYILQVNIQNEWKSLYSFDLQEQFPGDYEVANYYISKSPASHFTKDLMISLRASGCRYTLNNNKFNIYHYGKDVEKRTLTTVIQMQETLTDIFGLNLSGLSGLSSKLKSIILQGNLEA